MEQFEQEGTHGVPREDYVLVSCVPWYSYTALSFHMKSQRSFLRPMIVWGKYEERDGEVILPHTDRQHIRNREPCGYAVRGDLLKESRSGGNPTGVSGL